MSSPVEDQVAHYLAARARWRPLEYVFWLAAVASVFLLPGRHLILTEIALARLVRALARPHSRLCRDHIARSCRVLRSGLLCRRAPGQVRRRDRAGACAPGVRPVRRRARLRHQLSGPARLRSHAADGDARRRAHHARDRQPDPAAHRRRRRPPGRHRGAHPRDVRLRHLRACRLRLLPGRPVRPVRARAAHRLFPVRTVLAGDQGQFAAGVLDRHFGQRPAGRRLHARRLLRGRGRSAAGADHRLRLARRVLASSAPPTCCWC